MAGGCGVCWLRRACKQTGAGCASHTRAPNLSLARSRLTQVGPACHERAAFAPWSSLLPAARPAPPRAVRVARGRAPWLCAQHVVCIGAVGFQVGHQSVSRYCTRRAAFVFAAWRLPSFAPCVAIMCRNMPLPSRQTLAGRVSCLRVHRTHPLTMVSALYHTRSLVCAFYTGLKEGHGRLK